jgi:hypothetical protein
VEPSTTLLVLPDVLIDRLVTDGQQATALEMSGNLFRTPRVRQQALDQAKVFRTEALVTP